MGLNIREFSSELYVLHMTETASYYNPTEITGSSSGTTLIYPICCGTPAALGTSHILKYTKYYHY